MGSIYFGRAEALRFPDGLPCRTPRTLGAPGSLCRVRSHTFYALLMDIEPLGQRELDWSAFGDLDPRQPGTVVGVVSGGRVQEWRSFGAAGPFGEPLAPQSVIYVASIAKQFTAASVGLLALDGALGLEDDIRRHIAELPSYPSPVRVGHLLAHTSGLPPGHDLDRAAGMVARGRFSTADRARVIATAALQTEPGTAHQYSNHGYVLLAELVHRVSGVPLGEFAAARIFGPLGMSHTGFLDSAGCPKAVPGWTADGQRLDIAFTCVGDGGLVSCMVDLARWDGWLPSSPLAELMLGPRPSLPDGTWAHDAWGISVRAHRDRRVESHGGSLDGYLGSLVRFPEAKVSFIALANTDAGGVPAFGRRLRSFVDVTLAGWLDPDQPPWTETHGIPVG